MLYYFGIQGCSLYFLLILCVLMQLIFVYVEIDNEEVGKPVSEYFGVNGNGPEVIFFITSNIFIFK